MDVAPHPSTMRKQELIHVHALLADVRDELAATREGSGGAFDAYESHGVGPVEIYSGKEAHREAVTRLADGIEEVLEARDEAFRATGTGMRRRGPRDPRRPERE